ncbi:hypothetical protein CPC08DRAFT_807880 [Agrocybe pediades]|nr:hypothetical protein CPC08DRAFT_807880 [Agrocybe pediades]
MSSTGEFPFSVADQKALISAVLNSTLIEQFLFGIYTGVFAVSIYVYHSSGVMITLYIITVLKISINWYYVNIVFCVNGATRIATFIENIISPIGVVLNVLNAAVQNCGFLLADGLLVGVVRMYHFDRTILTILWIANIQRSSKNDNGRRDPDGGNVNCFSSYGAQVRKLRRASQAGLNQHAVGEYVHIQEREAWYTTMCILRDPDTFLDQTSRLATSSILGAMYDWDMSTPWAFLHDPKHFPNLDVLIPERFLSDGKLRTDIRDPVDIIFGYGRRVCPGNHIALSFLWITVSTIPLVYDITNEVDQNGPGGHAKHRIQAQYHFVRFLLSV